jgi:hypothetical protein
MEIKFYVTSEKQHLEQDIQFENDAFHIYMIRWEKWAVKFDDMKEFLKSVMPWITTVSHSRWYWFRLTLDDLEWLDFRFSDDDKSIIVDFQK